MAAQATHRAQIYKEGGENESLGYLHYPVSEPVVILQSSTFFLANGKPLVESVLWVILFLQHLQPREAVSVYSLQRLIAVRNIDITAVGGEGLGQQGFERDERSKSAFTATYVLLRSRPSVERNKSRAWDPKALAGASSLVSA